MSKQPIVPIRIWVVLVGLTICLALAAPAAEAQTCAGGPSFSSGPAQAYVGAQIASGSQAFAGGVGFGTQSPSGPRGFVSVGVANVDGADSAPVTIGGTFAYEIEGGDDSRVFVCPGAGVSYTNGPDFLGVDVSVLEFGGGGQVGVVAAQSSSVDVIPTFGIRMQRLRASALSVSASDTYGLANLGVGLIFNETMALTPAVAIPFSLAGGSDAVFSIAFAVNFGG